MISKGIRQRSFLVTVLFTTMLCIFAHIAQPAIASTGPTNVHDISELKGTLTYYLSDKINPWVSEKYVYKIGKLKNIKCSKKFLEVYPMGNGPLYVMTDRPGTANISFTYAGKKRSARIVVKKYTNPVKEVSLGGVNYKGKFNSRSSLYKPGLAIAGKKINVVPANGWKVQKIFAITDNGYKTIKNGKTLPKKAAGVIVEMRNKANNGHIYLGLSNG